MDRLPNLFAVVALTALAWLAPAAAVAQPPDTTDEAALAEARAIFMEGLGHSDRQEWHEAVANFRQVLELHSAPPVLYNLAAALIEIRDYPEAQERLEAVLADEATAEALRESATTMLAELEAKSAKLELSFEGEGLVLVDAYPVGPAAQQRPVFVTPGTHEVTARSGSVILARAEVDAPRGALTQAALAPVPSAEDAAVGAVEEAPAAPIAASRERPLLRNPWLWAGVGVAVVAIIVIPVAVTSGDSGVAAPHQGNLGPGMITW